MPHIFLPMKKTISVVDQLREAIEASGLSVPDYATDVLYRQPKTVYRWLAGGAPIPSAVVKLLNKKAA